MTECSSLPSLPPSKPIYELSPLDSSSANEFSSDERARQSMMEDISPAVSRKSSIQGIANRLRRFGSSLSGWNEHSQEAKMSKVDQITAVMEAEQTAAAAREDLTIDALRVEARKIVTGSKWTKSYDNFVIITSVVSCLEYIYQSYLYHFDNDTQIHYIEYAELGFGALFSLDWLLNLLIADHSWRYIYSSGSITDILTIFPIFATYGRERIFYHQISNTGDAFMFIIFGLKTVRMLRALCAKRKLAYIDDVVQRYVAEISISISIMILFFTAVMQYLEFSRQPYPFHTWMYYIWVTISTVGYGDITPETAMGRIFAMAMIGFAIVSIPQMTNELVEKMSLQSVYARAVYHPNSASSKHIVICGDLSSTFLRDFFCELFHEDHDNSDLAAVILLPIPPTVETIFLLRDPEFFMQLTYLEGSALVENDLRRAKAEEAEAIFIMTNKFGANQDEEDAKSILLNLSIKRYLHSQKMDREMLYCIQLIRPENQRHLMTDDVHGLNDNDLIVCLNEIKMGAMAKAVNYPGSTTLLMNLLSSFSDDALLDDDEEDDDYMSSSKQWIKEYMTGCGWEIYTTPLSELFIGTRFSELSYSLYNRLGIVLFALQIRDLSTHHSTLVLNPADFIIPDSSKFHIEAFVIAENSTAADLSFSGRSRGERLSSVFPESGFVRDSLNELFNAVPLTKPSPTNSTFAVIPTMNETNDSSVIDTKSNTQTRFKSSLDLTRTGKAINTDSQSPRRSQAGIINAGVESSLLSKEAIRERARARWNLLKRSALLQKKVETFSYQETLHRLEDQHFLENYYVRPRPAELKNVIIKTSVIEEIPYINHHLIVIGKGLHNLYDLIRPLRAKYLGTLRYIVLLFPTDIPHDVWQRICVFEAVVVVRGSPLEENHLRRAGIFRAAQVVVLSEGSGTDSKLSSGMEALVDSDAIFAYQHVRRMNPHTQIVSEIVNQSNIGYLEDADSSSSMGDYKFSPQFASGSLFTTNLLDSIICQAYYNPQIIKVVKKLLSGIDQMERADLVLQAAREVDLAAIKEDHDRARASHKQASHTGDDIDTNHLSEEEIEERRRQHEAEKKMAEKLAREAAEQESLARLRNSLSGVASSCLYQMSVPDNLNPCKYGNLFKHLSSQGIIPLGLLRGVFANLNVGPKANKLPYVFTNPPANTELYKCDRIFVLSTKPVSVLRPLNIKDWLLDIQMQQMRSKEASAAVVALSNKSTSSSSSLLPNAASSGGTFRDAMVERQIRRLSDRVEGIAIDVSNKFDHIINLLQGNEGNNSARPSDETPRPVTNLPFSSVGIADNNIVVDDDVNESSYEGESSGTIRGPSISALASIPCRPHTSDGLRHRSDDFDVQSIGSVGSTSSSLFNVSRRPHP